MLLLKSIHLWFLPSGPSPPKYTSNDFLSHQQLSKVFLQSNSLHVTLNLNQGGWHKGCTHCSSRSSCRTHICFLLVEEYHPRNFIPSGTSLNYEHFYDCRHILSLSTKCCPTKMSKYSIFKVQRYTRHFEYVAKFLVKGKSVWR